MIVERVLLAIDFNGQRQVLAIEVQDVRADRMLAAKLKSAKPASL
jgi:hypothetical protein